MRVFKVRSVARFARRERIGDGDLIEAIQRAERGIVDADLGGGLIKQRVARSGQGRSGGFRVLVAFRIGDRAVFRYGFAKNERDNIDPDELAELREVAEDWLRAGAERIGRALAEGSLQEVDYGGSC